MIKTGQDNVLALYCKDQKIVTNGKLLRVELGLPYQIMSFRYVGESSTEYTRGYFYNVIDCGPHWHTNEIVVWVTNNGHPETTDVDYCTAFSFDTFLSDFEYDSKYLELMNKAEKLQEQLNTAKKALTNIKLRTERDELETYYVERNHDIRKDAIDALAAIGGDDE
ncbi:hypothetical protein Tome1A_05305 [Lactococcus lactis subsp. lactis]|uniref:Prophage pi2 protein 22 n=6 Tax=Lactococcus lactis TaxID=1358 RepID=Q9CGR7_LACLA|nr:hypothetical protein [Lactococcus lactis]NP_076601.1 Orf29 [Lactococcus phage bIL285]MRM75913.1 hypothetical protein [Lactococcus cremoris]AAK05127.1 prophage pi2 protein 22 [Lactococcus lactis subsp. lactis Il1403]AAK08254.1 Orf29 [Lactococcus phage bIL285]ARD96037.1 hypothetical protein LL229_1152 [Lactococcus lactis subsp. lactis]ARE08266.1 hypothetical protein LLUC77_1151 [Lactococcus lactis subsp. lactis]